MKLGQLMAAERDLQESCQQAGAGGRSCIMQGWEEALLMRERHGVQLQAVLNANSTLFNSMLRSLGHYIVGT